jgi:hypothetical protein
VDAPALTNVFLFGLSSSNDATNSLYTSAASSSAFYQVYLARLVPFLIDSIALRTLRFSSSSSFRFWNGVFFCIPV